MSLPNECNRVKVFTDWNIHIAWAICIAESNGSANAHNYSDTTKDDSYGLFQINLYGNLALTRPAPIQLVDPAFNVQYAHAMWLGQGFTPWSTYKTGEYLRYIEN